MTSLKKSSILASLLAFTTVLTGCALGGEQAVRQIEETPPQHVTYVDEGTLEEDTSSISEEVISADEQEKVTDVVTRELYLLDKNGYVVPQTVTLPKTQEVAKQALEYLVEGGPITELLPNGFKAVLPAGTMVNGVNLKEGTLVVDFSEEFKNYQAEDELDILQAITYTLTQFDTVEKVKIQINGYDQATMPVNGTPINEGMSRANGINFDSGEVVDVVNSKAVTLYFLSQSGDNFYYVPVTRRVDKSDTNNIVATVNELIKGPSYSSELFSAFHDGIQLLDEPKYENGVVTLNFNDAVLGSLQGTAVSKNLLDSLVFSLTSQEGVESVALQVNGEEKLINELGDTIAAPVSRPKSVNTGSF